MLFVSVGVGAGTQSDRGVYWRDAAKSATATTVTVQVLPLFDEEEHESESKGNTEKAHDTRLAFEVRVGLIRSESVHNVQLRCGD